MPISGRKVASARARLEGAFSVQAIWNAHSFRIHSALNLKVGIEIFVSMKGYEKDMKGMWKAESNEWPGFGHAERFYHFFYKLNSNEVSQREAVRKTFLYEL